MYHFHLYPRRSICSGLSLARLKEEILNYFEGRVSKEYLGYIKNDTLCIKVEDYHFYLRFDRSAEMADDLRSYFRHSKGMGALEPYIDQDWLQRAGMRIELLGENDMLKEYVEECLVIVEYFAKTRAYVMVPATYKN